jgi:hypothetical protein
VSVTDYRKKFPLRPHSSSMTSHRQPIRSQTYYRRRRGRYLFHQASFDHCLKKTHVCTDHEAERNQPAPADQTGLDDADDEIQQPVNEPTAEEANFADWLENLDEPESIPT